MSAPTPVMLEVLRRIDRDVRREQSATVHAFRYPLQQIKGLEERGLVEREECRGVIGGVVRLTDAGRALLEPPTVGLDDLQVLDEESAPWPAETDSEERP